MKAKGVGLTLATYLNMSKFSSIFEGTCLMQIIHIMEVGHFFKVLWNSQQAGKLKTSRLRV